MTGPEAMASFLGRVFPEATFDVAIVDGDLHVLAHRPGGEISSFFLGGDLEDGPAAARDLLVAIGDWSAGVGSEP